MTVLTFWSEMQWAEKGVTIQNILLAANPSTAFLQKASWPGKNHQFELQCIIVYTFWSHDSYRDREIKCLKLKLKFEPNVDI